MTMKTWPIWWQVEQIVIEINRLGDWEEIEEERREKEEKEKKKEKEEKKEEAEDVLERRLWRSENIAEKIPKFALSLSRGQKDGRKANSRQLHYGAKRQNCCAKFSQFRLILLTTWTIIYLQNVITNSTKLTYNS